MKSNAAPEKQMKESEDQDIQKQCKNNLRQTNFEVEDRKTRRYETTDTTETENLTLNSESMKQTYNEKQAHLE
jgi:hypothetical protein